MLQNFQVFSSLRTHDENITHTQLENVRMKLQEIFNNQSRRKKGLVGEQNGFSRTNPLFL